MDLPPLLSGRSRVRHEFADFYRREVRFAWRVLLRLGVGANECEDALQDVFATVHQRWHTVREPERRHAWLGGIVRRIAWRYRRTRDRRERRLEAVASLSVESPRLDDELARREAWAALLAFLEQLDEGRREAFVLGELESLGRTELGDALGINANTAYSRLQSARRTFFTHFAGYDDAAIGAMIAVGDAPSRADQRAWARAWSGLLGRLALPAAGLVPKLAVAWAAIAAIGTSIALAPVSDPPRVSPPAPARVETVADVMPAAVPSAVHGAVRATEPEPIARDATQIAKRQRAAPVRTPPTDVAATPTIDAEVALLVAARSALARGSIADARRLLDEHRERFGDAGALDRLRRDLEAELASSITPTPSGD